MGVIVAGVVLTWLGFASAGGYVAIAKNRPPLEGAVFGALLGPIGVLVEVMLPTLERIPLERYPISRKRQVEEEEDLPEIRNWHDWTAAG